MNEFASNLLTEKSSAPGNTFKKLPKSLIEIINPKMIIKEIRFFKSKFRSLFDLINKAIKKNRDTKIVVLTISLKTTRYNLLDRKKETIRIIARKANR